MDTLYYSWSSTNLLGRLNQFSLFVLFPLIPLQFCVNVGSFRQFSCFCSRQTSNIAQYWTWRREKEKTSKLRTTYTLGLTVFKPSQVKLSKIGHWIYSPFSLDYVQFRGLLTKLPSPFLVWNKETRLPSLIKNIKQTAVINILKTCILWTWRFVC